MFGNIGKMMKLASEMKTRMPELQARLAESLYTADAGDGAVKATVSGKLLLVNIEIDPSLVDGDAARLEDLVRAAVSAAQQQAATAAAEAMRELTGGLELPGMTDMMP